MRCLVAVAMLMFTSFEHSVNFIYGHVLNRHKSECSLGTQLGVTCMAGYMSGVTGTIISNPADNILTALYNNKGSTSLQAARRIGIVGLFTRSLPLRVMLVGPLVTAQWFCYDTCKVLSGL
jgi:solute carrier family 25 phosphate transporter 3